ncbi:MAG: Phosphorylated carbohydrates phosphatase [Pelotomaculum sp. PtaB.Bin104]|nr:MAG: Phosphorylated carbohydrates phosphatase [Pelotomaculum sp. PtaB.Bin104]
MITNKKWFFFDLDGTLADSIPAMKKAYFNFLHDFDINGTLEEFEELNGPSISEIVNILKRKYGLVYKQKHLVDLYRREVKSCYINFARPANGAQEILTDLKNKKYNLLLVTSAYRELAFNFIVKQKWNSYFQDYVFGDEVKKAKPDAQIYSIALKRANTTPEAVVAVEDSPNGIKSAKSAGLYVIGLTGTHPVNKLLDCGADMVISHLKDVLTCLETKNAL